MRIKGRWKVGYVLDYHTVRSEFLGYDELGHAKFDTTYTEIGELLYKHKYKSDRSATKTIAREASDFIKNTWQLEVDLVVPVPPTKVRSPQPLFLLAEALAGFLGASFTTSAVKPRKRMPQLKDIGEYDRRLEILKNAYSVDRSKVEGLRVLLFDDLYRSGATMEAVTQALYEEGGAKTAFGFAITRTRSKI
ncbi:MAG: ComF family protein [Candidatus Binatia bacterium]